MKRSIKYLFTSGYTGRGYYSYLPGILAKLEQVIFLQGAPGSGKSTFMKKIGLTLAERGYEVHFWPSPLDPAYLDGIYLPPKRTAVVDGNLPSTADFRNSGGAIHYLNFNEYCNQQEGSISCDEIKCLADQVERLLESVTNRLEIARRTREQIEKNHIAVNIEKLQVFSHRLSREILGWEGRENHYFAGVISSEGVVDYCEEISKHCHSRYILQGPPGCGKSWLMLNIARESLAQGRQVSFYHSGLDPDSLEMVVIEDLKVALVDGNTVGLVPQSGDRKIDMYGYIEVINDDDGGLKAQDMEDRLSYEIYQAIKNLQKAREVERKLSQLVTKAMAFDGVDDRREELIKEILNME